MSKIIRWGMVITWALVIFWFSSQPIISTNTFELSDYIVKKCAHIAEYTLLYILLFRALDRNQSQHAFLLGLIYAFSDEMHQLFTPGRTGMLRDVLTFDLIGLTLGSVLVERYLQRINKYAHK